MFCTLPPFHKQQSYLNPLILKNDQHLVSPYNNGA